MRRLLLLLLVLVAVPALAAPKVALVVAVGQYRAVATLANPPRDAQLVGAALRTAGFAVTPLIDPDRGALVAALAAFRQRSVGAEAAIIYFAGHGVEVEGANLLLPIDVLAGSPDEVKLSAINARQLASAVGPASRLRLVVLDACRDNPFAAAPGATRSLGTSRGLAREAISGVVTILATQAGQRAEDRSKLSPANSPFARAFAEVISQAGLEVVRLPTRLARAMAAGDGIAQQPDQIGIWLDDEYRLRPVLASVMDSKPPPVVARPTGNSALLINTRAALAGITPTLFDGRNSASYTSFVANGGTVAGLAALAATGNPHALTILGWLHERGDGVVQDSREAVRLYRLAAFQDYSWGQYLLASAFAAGRGVSRDEVAAARLFRLAADQGLADAEFAMGNIYVSGYAHLAKDRELAITWLRKAAKQGHGSAKFTLQRIGGTL